MLKTGDLVGLYRIEGLLGTGGMGEIYRAWDPRLHRHVAMKVLPPYAASPDAVKRFRNEAKAVAALSHPNILVIHDFGSHHRTHYAVSELLEGENLEERLRRGAYVWREAVQVALAVIEGLAAAHARGVVHRDLKPSNIFLTSDGRVKILDFGLAFFDARLNPQVASTRPTPPGTVIGSSGYMSPEQLLGEEVDYRTDFFSFGCMLYEMLSGRRAFAFKAIAEAILAVLEKDPDPLSEPALRIPDALQSLVFRCLAKKIEDRYPSADEIRRALVELAAGESSPAEDAPTGSPADRSVAILRARYFWNRRTRESLLRSRAAFEKALDRDPDSAAAHAGLADVYNVMPFWGLAPPLDAFPKAKAAARRALELDGDLAEAHASMAYAEFYFDWDWAAASASFRKALELRPSYATARHWYGVAAAFKGDFETALRELHAARDLEPLSLMINADLALVWYLRRRPERSLELCREVEELDERFAPAHLYRGLALEQLDRVDDAIRSFEETLELTDRSSPALAALAHGLARAGQRSRASDLLEELAALAKTQYVSRYPLAVVHWGLRDAETAHSCLRKARRERSEMMVWRETDPRLEGLR